MGIHKRAVMPQRIDYQWRNIMRLYSYMIPRDSGIAPNPYFNYCTLATSKPIIRKCAQRGDWVAAFGSVDTALHGKLVMLMRVEEILTFDEYWEDKRFQSKRPVFDKEIMYTYGDNIYHHEGLTWLQERSSQSMEDGSTNYVNLKRDTQTNRVLIATEFYYFGNKAINLPDEFGGLIAYSSGNGVYADKNAIEAFVKYISENYDVGMHGSPHCGTSGMNEG